MSQDKNMTIDSSPVLTGDNEPSVKPSAGCSSAANGIRLWAVRSMDQKDDVLPRFVYGHELEESAHGFRIKRFGKEYVFFPYATVVSLRPIDGAEIQDLISAGDLRPWWDDRNLRRHYLPF